MAKLFFRKAKEALSFLISFSLIVSLFNSPLYARPILEASHEGSASMSGMEKRQPSVESVDGSFGKAVFGSEEDYSTRYQDFCQRNKTDWAGISQLVLTGGAVATMLYGANRDHDLAKRQISLNENLVTSAMAKRHGNLTLPGSFFDAPKVSSAFTGLLPMLAILSSGSLGGLVDGGAGFNFGAQAQGGFSAGSSYTSERYLSEIDGYNSIYSAGLDAGLNFSGSLNGYTSGNAPSASVPRASDFSSLPGGTCYHCVPINNGTYNPGVNQPGMNNPAPIRPSQPYQNGSGARPVS